MLFPVSLEDRAQIIEVLDGEHSIIQAPNSDVRLQAPKGVHGVVFGTVHTNHQQFLYLILDSDCLICPVCEYVFHPDETKNKPDGKFKLLIPHIVKDITNVKGQILVRQVASKSILEILPVSTQFETSNAYWNIDDKYIIIYTRKFSKFVITAKKIKCCGRSVEMLVFGRWEDLADGFARVDLRTYLGSEHCRIKDYLEVRIACSLRFIH